MERTSQLKSTAFARGGQAPGDSAAAWTEDREPPPSPLRVGSETLRVGRYVLGHLLGRGGGGEVFAGFDPLLDRPVAIKRLFPQASDSSQLEESLRNEARHAARLSHPGIVRLYDVLRVDGIDFIISELIDGTSLSETLQSLKPERLPLDRALQIACAVIEALGYAHDQDVVHRDVKAANVIVAKNGEIRLSDFGISATSRGLGPLRAAPMGSGISGTCHAMSPEQSLGEYTDARSDLFSFGALLYELISGTAPFWSPDRATCLRLVREARPLPLAELRPDVPLTVSRLAERLLEKRREDRPESAREVKAILSTALAAVQQVSQDNARSELTERQLAVVCVRVAPLDGPLGARPDVAALEASEMLHQAVVDAGGSLLSSVGRYVIFCIGYPVPQENNCEVALRLLIDLGSRTPWPRERMAVGVDCGLVTILPRSQSVLASGLIIDDAIRVAEAGGPGTISVTLAAQTLARRFFRFVPLPHALLAASRNAPLYQVVGDISHDAGIEQASSTPLIGRRTQIDLLERAFQDAQQGAIVTRIVVGDAGVGKSRLLHEWRQQSWRAADSMLTAYATSHEQHSPFAPLVRLWRAWFGLHNQLDAATQRTRMLATLERNGLRRDGLADTLSHVFGIALADNPLTRMPSERRRRQIIDMFVWLLVDLAEARFVVFTVEDLHFVDCSTLEVLQRAAENPRPARLLLVLTSRPEFLGSWPLAKRISPVHVERLGAGEALRLIESLAADTTLPAGVTRRLVELGDGVPLVLEELTRGVLADAQRWSAAEGTGLSYPTSLADSVARRLDTLGPAREIIDAAATLGRESSVALLHAVVDVGAEEFRSRLHRLDMADLAYVREVDGEKRCIFSHALIHDAVSRAMGNQQRLALHRKLVTVLEGRFPELVEATPERFAHLYSTAGESQRAFALFESAAQRAAENSAHSEASAHLQAALFLLQSSPLGPNAGLERRLRQALGPCLMAIEGWGAGSVAENLEKSRALGGQGEIRELWGLWAHGIVTHDAEGVRSAMASIGKLPPSPEQRFVAFSTEGVTAFYRGQFGSARAHLEQAVSMLRTGPPDPGSPRDESIDLAIARTWGCEFAVAASLHLSWLEVLCDRRAQGEVVHLEAEEVLKALSVTAELRELRHGLYMRVHLGLTLRDYDYFGYSLLSSSTGPLYQLLQLAGTGLPFYRCVGQIGEARARVAAGDASALADLIDAYRRMKALSRAATGHVFLATIIGEACLEAGQARRAEDFVLEAVEITGSEFARFYAPEAHRVHAAQRLSVGDFAGAHAALGRARSAITALAAAPDTPALLFERRLALAERTFRETTRATG
jgi:tRNA A-37 threonylcarbamoyl transferase component Bud32